MMKNTKQRIVQLKNGEIPTGYKKTDFGIFPCDWEIVSIGSVSTNRGEYGLNAPACTRKGGLPKYIRITDIDENGNYVDNGACVDYSDTNGQYTLKPGDIVFARTGASVGRNYLYRLKDGELVFAGFLIKFSVDEKVANPYIVYANCNTKTYDDWVKKISARSGQPGINAEEYCTYKFCKPKSLSEQAKIAEILMTWDKAIELYEKQIEKLKQYKKICLKKMFPAKGQTVPEWRFKGFTGEWVRRKIGECFSERIESDPKGELISVTIDSGIKRFSELERHNNSSEDKSSYKRVLIGDIAYNSMRMWQGASGYSPYNGIVSPAYTVITPKPGINSLFFSYLFKNEEMIHTFQVHSQGMTSDNWNLKFPELKKINVFLPHNYTEQQTISSFFAQLDCNIALHQSKLEAEQKRRKALQQYLLNGIIRVKA